MTERRSRATIVRVTVDLSGVDLAAECVRTRRLLLRPYRDTDIPDMVRALNDPQVTRWLPMLPSPYAEQDARDFLSTVVTGEAKGGTGMTRAMAEPASGRLVGAIGVSGLTGEHGAVLGYWVAPWGRGHGYAAEASDGLARWAFGHGVHRVFLLAAVANLASCRTAERAGFLREGVQRQSHRHREGRYEDMALYGRLATDPVPAMLGG